MNDQKRRLIAGNWKMNGLKGQGAEITALLPVVMAHSDTTDVVICPPTLLIAEFARLALGTKLALGGQDCHEAVSGAFTGDVSAEMLVDAGASFVILGHSERRHFHHETDAEIAKKLEAAWRAGLQPIVCVGESLEAREAGDTLNVLDGQLDGALGAIEKTRALAIAYEPIWAIGTGKTPSLAEISQVHRHIRSRLADFVSAPHSVRLLYGGSVNPKNAGDILRIQDVDGALVGGASLKAVDFSAIIAAGHENKI